MLIYLLPDGPHPRVYHTVNFTDPYNRVPLPNNWAAQLHCLHMDELDLPTATHALDKACWLTAIIDELVFDMVSQTVSCSFSNGPTLQWSLRRQPACVAALEDVLADLAQSRNEQDKERAATQPSPKATTPKQRHVSLPPPVLTKSAKHKKQRSLLSSLISSFNKLGSGTPPQDVPTTPSPSRSSFSPPSSPSRVCWKLAADFLPPSQKTPLAQTLSRPLSMVLQARARSRLVDAFRRFVLAEVKARITPGGYAHWAARCMLRRSENHMAWLVQESGGVFLDLTRPMPPSRMTSALSGKTLVSVGDASTEDGDDEVDRRSLTPSMSTETDGSSIHTPVDSPSHSPFAPPPPPKHTGSTAQRMPRSPSPAEFTAEDWATYQSLNAQCMRLRQLLVRMDAARADTEQDERNFQAVLEVKSRRRAWSNRVYMGGAPLSGIGLALPFRSSPLARCESVTPELLCTTLLEVSTGDHNIATLFPVSEEDEDEEDSVPFSLAPDAALRDLESGLLPPLTRPQMRARTHSMHPMRALDVDLPLCPDPPKLLVPPQPPPMTATRPMTPTPPLYQPLNKSLLETQTKCELFEHAERGGEDEHELGVGVGVRVGPEFTLAMDLPPPYARTVGAEHDGWIDSREEVSC
ncbi:uncharacterized protein LAESUDRAFT_528824 [Laetiporus sulphureus 93-53]|uniref:Uncharacterized protein n=1 Tax=Laetiporus sulphureus 93-53 TaxID=1314785 RepID=A0A165BBP2_9APHY|nr:uncharacterized protein LAESUDRAFT_528824 [Laetiporus sulphureus 93-53]KZT00687.1 hypothetical protein LAESUDRAFT_528824 [Laetiporus sulphureus 93-53]